MNKNLLLIGIASASMSVLAIAAPASANNDQQIPSHKVGICHATGSATNPYVFIVVDKHAAEAHKNHQDGRDVIGVSSADKCPKAAVAGKGGNATPSPKTDSKGQVLSDETKPSSLPKTGATAGLSALIGLPAMALAGRAYLRSRAR
jgi:LPXTG-motif cell wall-anchored protein